jgi:CheY-like chemotaxis protein/HD-like signal output (HDOD) protein
MNHERDSFDQSRERISELQISPLEYKIVQIAKNDRVPVQSLGEIIAREPLLALRLLRLANLISGLPQTLSTLPQSISFLGLDHLKALTLGLSLFSLAPVSPTDKKTENEDGSATLRQLWEHSIGCATIAGRIAEKVGNVSPHFAFVAGFLHDVGRLLLYRYSKDRFVESIAVAMEKNIPLTEAETLASGFNHLELGELWSGKVELQNSLKEVIRYHHEPPCMIPDSVADEVRKTIPIVRLADLACERQAIGNGGERGDGIEELWSAFNLRPEQSTDELRMIKQEIESAREIFGFSKDDPRKTVPLRRSPIPVEAGLLSESQKVAANGRRGQLIPFPARNDYSPRGEENASPKRLTILVVEDHGSLCEMLSLYLIRHGYHVRTADNGQAALNVLAKEEIDLVLLDLMLPRMDGFAVLKHVRETHEYQKPYIIVVSAGASEKDRNRVLELGANEYMPKPFHLMRLLERIQAVEKYLLR